MKKILSIILTASMMLALILTCAVSVSAAIEGDWNVYAKRSAYESEEKLEETCIPGYEYTTEGLHMIPANWSQSTPWGIVQTKEQIDLRQGVYMEVRVDNFTYAGDKWFGFNIWEEQIDEFPNEEDYQALGFEALIRLNEDKTINYFQLNEHTVVGESAKSGGTTPNGVKDEIDSNGRPVCKLCITWSEESGYNVSINGADLGADFNKRFTAYFDGKENDGKAYVSFSLQNSIKGGTAECTVLKFGTSPTNCETPNGEDSEKPINNNVAFAEIADKSTVPEGEPAVFLNGSRESSHLRRTPGSTNNCLITINDDYSINVSTTTNWASISMQVAPEISYDAKDFPIMMMITRNFCTCEWTEESPYCECNEAPNIITMAGDAIAEELKNQIPIYSYSFEPFWGGDDNMYMYYIADWSDFSGRINGFRLDIYDIRYSEEGRNNFDICEVGFFRNMDEAESYFEEFMELTEEDDEIDTDLETDSETESETETDPETESEKTTDFETALPEESDSEAPTEIVTSLPEESASETEAPEVIETETQDMDTAATDADTEEESTEESAEISTSAPESDTSASQDPESETVNENEQSTGNEKETEKATEKVTEEATETDTQKVTDKVTEKETEAQADKETNAGETDADEDKAGGCSSAIGIGSFALIVTAVGAIAFAKKREE